MALTSTATFNVVDQQPVTLSAATVVQVPVAFNAGGRGRMVHPTLGVYEYINTPDEVVDIDGDICIRPIWAHAMTLGGAVDGLWSGYPRDVTVIERWKNGEVGCPIAHLRQMWQFFANPPDPVTGSPIIWTPNYATARSYRVIIADVRSGGQRYTIDVRLARDGFAPSPVEVELRILGYAD